jgi:hypothetical protein
VRWGSDLDPRLSKHRFHLGDAKSAWIALAKHTQVADYGVHNLPDATAAQVEALELARSLR